MPARRAYGFIYDLISSRMDEAGQLELDALLGDQAAATELQERRRSALVDAGVEFG